MRRVTRKKEEKDSRRNIERMDKRTKYQKYEEMPLKK